MNTSPTLSRATFPLAPGLSRERLLWLVRLRWFALAGVTVATALAAMGLNPGVNLPVLVAALVAGATFNLYFLHQIRVSELSRLAAMVQVLVDIGALTLVLWAGGGPDVPFRTFYFFHIIIGGILVGPGAAVVTAVVALAAVAFLELSRAVPLLQISQWTLPSPAWEKMADLIGLGLTVAFLAYFVTHIMDELRTQLQAVAEERERAANALARLTFTLDRMDAGMEVLDHQGRRLWFNQTFQRLFPEMPVAESWRCPGSSAQCGHGCPVLATFTATEAHRCMVAVERADRQETYELISWPLSTDRSAPQVMNLYLNRTRELALQRRVDQAERLAAFGRLAQGLAHELNTPLGTIHALASDIRTVLGSLDKGADDGELADISESCALIQDESRRCRSITTALLSGRDLYGEDAPRTVDVRQLVEHACVRAFSGEERRPAVRITTPEGVSLQTDPDRMTQVLLNLLRNAHDAAGEGGHIEVDARQVASGILLVVRDDGPGIPPEVAGRLFEPFFTTKDPGQGTGLGLYTSYQIVQRLGGHIEVESLPDRGAEVRVWLPLTRSRAPAPSLAPAVGDSP